MSDLLTVLPNLSIGVVAVLAMVYLVNRFTDASKEQSARHEKAMKEREDAFRALEKEIRDRLIEQLNQNTAVMQRVLDHFNR